MKFGVLSEETGCKENAPVSKFVAPGAVSPYGCNSSTPFQFVCKSTAHMVTANCQGLLCLCVTHPVMLLGQPAK